MSTPTILQSTRKIVVRLFPWIARIGTNLATGALGIRSAAGRTELEGGGLAVARVGDFVVRLYRDTVSGILYASTSTAAPYAWAPVASGAIPPTIADAGTAINITTGSGKVTCG